jgi:hypothetical protein
MTAPDGSRGAYTHRYLAGDLLIGVQPPDPRFFPYHMLDRSWATSYLPQTIHRLQIRTICSASAKVLIVVSVAPISPLAPSFPDIIFNAPNTALLVPFTTSMDKVVAIGGCTYFDTSFIDIGRSVAVPAYHALCIQIVFSNPQLGQTARVTATYSLK